MAESGVTQRVAAILAADVAGYTRLMADDETATIDALDAARAVFIEQTQANQGRIVDTAGDSVLSVFETTAGAARAAMAIQARLGEINAPVPEPRRMLFRIGLHLGDIHEKTDGTIYGDGVNIAARLEGLAEPGAVMVSDVVQGALRDRLDVAFADAGSHEVKNVKNPVRAYRVLAEGETAPVVPGRRHTSVLILASAALAVAAVIAIALWPTSESPPAPMLTAQGMPTDDPILAMPTGPAIAVLPFEDLSEGADNDYFANGLTEDLIVGLSRFPSFLVIARNSTLRYKGQSVDVREVGRDLGARFVVEGSVRRADDELRVAVHLVDGRDGTELWAEKFDRDLSAASVFEIQDEITAKIAGTIGDASGIVARTDIAALRDKRPENLSAYECWLRLIAYYDAVTPEGHLLVRDCATYAVEIEPDYATGWLALGFMAMDEHRFGLNPEPDSMDRSISAFRRAIEIDPNSQTARQGLAEALFAAGKVDAFLVETERAIALNPNASQSLAALGNKLMWAGHLERGMALTEKAAALNPYHPSWYFFTYSAYHYLNRDYERSLAATLKIEWLDFHWTQMLLAANFGQLGRGDEARAAVTKLLELYPSYANDAWQEYQNWNLPMDARERFAEGLAKAGLDIAITEPVPGAPTRPVIAVLPFDSMSGDADHQFFADGIAEDIITRLARFPDIGVIARNSSFQYKGEAVDVRSVAEELGATYVLEGSVRQTQNDIRVIAQLLDASDGTHVWAETYDRDLTAGSIFEVQDDITERVVGAIASGDSAISLAMIESAKTKAPSELASYECVLKAYEYWRVITPDAHLEARNCLERVIGDEPHYATALAALAGVTSDEFVFGYNPLPDLAPSLDRALAYSQQAVDADPTSATAHWNLARAAFFRHNMPLFRSEAERGVELAPSDTFILAGAGHMLAYSGSWEKGMALMAKAIALNPHHQTWYHFPQFYDAYRQGLDEDALAAALRITMPGFFWTHTVLAAAYGQLGMAGEAAGAVETLRTLYPGYTVETLQQHMQVWNFEDALIARMADGLRKAGLPEAAPEAPSRPVIAVLPFDSMSEDPTHQFFADGIAEDIITRLARFPDIGVIARNSSFQYKGEAVDVRSVAEELGATYVLEGSVRRSENDIRVIAQLLDAGDGTHLWAETYDRDLSAGSIFEIQDDITDRVVGAIASADSIIAMAVTGASAGKAPADLASYECVMRAMDYWRVITPAAHLLARTCLEHVISEEPDYAQAYAVLAGITTDELFGYNPQPDLAPALDRALRYGERAIDLDTTSGWAHWALGRVLYFRHDLEGFRSEAERAVALAPNEAMLLGGVGAHLCYSGSWERGFEILERAIALNPHHQTWYHIPYFYDAYRQGHDKDSLAAARRMNMPGFFWKQLMLAAAYGQLDMASEATGAVATLRELYPGYTIQMMIEFHTMWNFEDDVIARMADGLRKAGLPENAD
jgi:adenylate cyclase